MYIRKDILIKSRFYYGASRGARTPDAWIRSPALYPTELQMQNLYVYYNIKKIKMLDIIILIVTIFNKNKKIY